MKDYGDKYDYDSKWKGPLEKRSCTDSIFLLIFGILIICWLMIGVYAVKRGNLSILKNVKDSEGKICGVDSEVVDAPYLVYFNIYNCLFFYDCYSVCRKECPTNNFIYSKADLSFKKLKEKMICKTEVNLSKVVTKKQLDNLVSEKKCVAMYYKSEPKYNRCLPTNIWKSNNDTTINKVKLDTATKVIEFFAGSTSKETLEDIKTTWPVVFLIVTISGMIAAVHILLLKCFATSFMYTSIVGGCLILIYWIVKTLQLFLNTKSSEYLIGSISIAIILVIIVISVIYGRRKIYLACQLIQEASIAVTNISSSLFYPILPYVIYIIILASSIIVGLYIESIVEPNYQMNVYEAGKCICPEELHYTNNSQCNPKTFIERCNEDKHYCVSASCDLISLKRPMFVNFMQAINIIGFLWMTCFVSAFEQMILAVTFATWYWTFKKKDVSRYIVAESIFRTIRYHLGTLAYGSLLITICDVIRMILEWISDKCKSFGLIFCAKVCFYFLDRFLHFFTQNAYIMCAIHGKGLYYSARDAFNLIMRNVGNVIILTKTTEWLLAFAQLYITGLAMLFTWICYNLLEIQPVHHWFVPFTLVAIGSYLVTSIFFSVQSGAVDTLFLCFLEDCERNDGSTLKPYYMSQRLHTILQKS